jgi:hypothetical protein
MTIPSALDEELSARDRFCAMPRKGFRHLIFSCKLNLAFIVEKMKNWRYIDGNYDYDDMNLFTRFSSRENLEKAYRHIKDELAHSSLAVAPINHAATTAIDDLGEQFFIALESYLRDEAYDPEKGFFVYIPKDNLGLRPVCILSMIDRIVYQALFNQSILGFKIDGQLSEKVCFANRVNEDEKDERFISPYFKPWENFCEQQEKAFNRGFIWKLDVDMQQYYEHISIDKLVDTLRGDFGIKDNKLLTLLQKMLCAWTEDAGMPKGIPQGPNASAILANAYLAPLDELAENELIGRKLRYFRYADDIVLMGRDRTDVLIAAEKIVRFLRERNLTLNEKTKIEELSDSTPIETMKLFSEYDNDTLEIPADNLAGVQEKVPDIIRAIQNGEYVEKIGINELKYFLANGTDYSFDFILSIIKIIPIKPSLITPIVRYVGEGRSFLEKFGDSMDPPLIDDQLWEIYKMRETPEWSRFWILKLLVSNKDVLASGLGDEIKRIIAAKNETILKVIGFYYDTIQEKNIKIGRVKQAIKECSTNVEKSIFSFFLLGAFTGERVPVVRECIGTALGADSNEINLIGCYLNKNSPAGAAKDAEGAFSNYILNPKNAGRKKIRQKDGIAQHADFYMVAKANLIPADSAPTIFGLNRKRRTKSAIDLTFPEMVKWEKVTIKIKEGLREVEIWYGGDLIEATDYIKLGFYSGEKEKRPDRKWDFLKILSVLCGTDIRQATVANMATMLSNYGDKNVRPATVHQIKRGLVKELRGIFKTSDNPFHENKDYYEPRFKLVPEQALRAKALRKQGGYLNENAESEDNKNEF